MRSVHEIDKELAELREQLATVSGTETEIYTRIVGYYRSLKNWNRGKREEYDLRQTFNVGEQMRSVPKRTACSKPPRRVYRAPRPAPPLRRLPPRLPQPHARR